MYELTIYRSDENHIIMRQSEDFNSLLEEWEDLNNKWKSSVQEQTPFVIKDPVVTAFNPSLIYEIRIYPIHTNQNMSSNPYQKTMLKTGLSGMFNQDLSFVEGKR